MVPQDIDFSSWNEKWRRGYYDCKNGIRANPLLEYWNKRINDFYLMCKSNDYDFGQKEYTVLSYV